jgi:hypothetical protein
MARFATIAAGVALIFSQPAFAAPAQPVDDTAGAQQMDSHSPFFSNPGKIVIALGALGAFTWGVINATKGNGHGRRPTSP